MYFPRTVEGWHRHTPSLGLSGMLFFCHLVARSTAIPVGKLLQGHPEPMEWVLLTTRWPKKSWHLIPNTLYRFWSDTASHNVGLFFKKSGKSVSKLSSLSSGLGSTALIDADFPYLQNVSIFIFNFLKALYSIISPYIFHFSKHKIPLRHEKFFFALNACN